MIVLSLFDGISGARLALERAGIKVDKYYASEIDKYAIKSYCAIHNETEDKNFGDITKIEVNDIQDIDMFVYSPPCQSFSVAGKQKGFEDNRGVLFFDALKIMVRVVFSRSFSLKILKAFISTIIKSVVMR